MKRRERQSLDNRYSPSWLRSTLLKIVIDLQLSQVCQWLESLPLLVVNLYFFFITSKLQGKRSLDPFTFRTAHRGKIQSCFHIKKINIVCHCVLVHMCADLYGSINVSPLDINNQVLYRILVHLYFIPHYFFQLENYWQEPTIYKVINLVEIKSMLMKIFKKINNVFSHWTEFVL